jgi:hypothetical protein
MAKGDEAPKFQTARINDLPGGGQSFDFATKLMANGLPQDLKDAMTNQFQGNQAGQLRSGEQALRESFASQGNAPSGSLLSGLVSQQSNANNSAKDYYANLLNQDFGARQQGFNNLTNIQSLIASLTGQKNDYNMNKYKIDKENEFSWGQFLGDALGFGSKFIK